MCDWGASSIIERMPTRRIEVDARQWTLIEPPSRFFVFALFHYFLDIWEIWNRNWRFQRKKGFDQYWENLTSNPLKLITSTKVDFNDSVYRPSPFARSHNRQRDNSCNFCRKSTVRFNRDHGEKEKRSRSNLQKFQKLSETQSTIHSVVCRNILLTIRIRTSVDI